MNYIRLFILFALFPSLTAVAQDRERFTVISWNVENLFDTVHDSLKLDQEFLPEAVRGWNYPRYQQKLSDIARTIAAIGEDEIPALIGLSEVENDAVLTDLTQHSPLKAYGYKYVMTDSPDERGIDVALLYQSDKFKVISANRMRVDLGEGERPTRDILHVTGIVPTMDTLDVFVAHLPSRSGGEKESEPKRMIAAKILKDASDSLAAVRATPRILMMGDFNDYPDNRSIAEVLNVKLPDNEMNDATLYHLLARECAEKSKNATEETISGSYKYRGEWGLLDHLIVNGGLLNTESRFFTSESHAQVVQLPFLLTEDTKYGGVQPFRTYVGQRYAGGYSDHLPVKVDFEMVFE